MQPRRDAIIQYAAGMSPGENLCCCIAREGTRPRPS